MNYDEVLDTAREVLEAHDFEVTSEHMVGGAGPGATFLDVDLGESSKIGGSEVEDLVSEGIVVVAIMPWGHRKHQHETSSVVEAQGEDVDRFVRLWFREIETEIVTKYEIDTREEVEINLPR